MLFVNRNKHNFHSFPIQQLPNELILNLLPFCHATEVVHFSYSCKEYYHIINQQPETRDFLWKELCRVYLQNSWLDANVTKPTNTTTTTTTTDDISTDDNTAANDIVERIELELKNEKRDVSQELILTCENWKEQFKDLCSYKFDVECTGTNRIMEYSNCRRTVENPEGPTSGYWATTRCRNALKPGNRYMWTISLDKFTRDSHNTWWIMLGIEDEDFPFASQQSNDVIGYQSHHNGVALIVGPGTITHKGNRSNLSNNDRPFEQGDTFAFVVDMTSSASYMLFYFRKGDEWVLLNRMDNLPQKVYYPAVSLNQKMKVTVGSGVKWGNKLA